MYVYLRMNPKIQKRDMILCASKPYFLIPGHN